LRVSVPPADLVVQRPASRSWPAAVGFAVAAAAGVALSASIASGGPILAARGGILARLAAWSVAWGLAVVCALRLPKRVALGAVLLAGVALRLAALAGPPTLSDDLYRYSWDGRVQAAGVDPYRYTPSSSHLLSLRERWLWPDELGCDQLHRPPGCTRINRPVVRTIYPPLAQAWFATVYRLAGISAHHKAWQVAGLLGDVALIGLLPLALRAWGRDERWTALYALSPFPVLEVVNNGHVDGLAALFVIGALLLAARRRPAWAGALIGAAALIKLYPLLLVVGVAVAGGKRLRTLATAGAAAAAVVVAGYLPHVLAVGPRVLGYLPGYLREEHYTAGGRFLLARFGAVALTALAAVVVWILVRRPSAPRACAALVGSLLLATTPVQPWYAVTLLAVATVAAAPVWSLVAAAGYPYFFAVILDAPHAVTVGRLSYGLALAAVAAGAAVRSRRDRATIAPPHPPATRRVAPVAALACSLLLVGPVAGMARPQGAVGIPRLPVLGPSRDAYDGDLGDPSILPVHDGGPFRFIAFGTGDWPARVPTAYTTDLVTWQAGPDALPELPAWAGPDPTNSRSWAPAALAVGKRYILYITLPEASSGLQCIAAATSPVPEGPYTDRGTAPMLCQRDLGGSIDPAVVTDRSGGLHMLWKNDGNCCGHPTSLWEQKMTPDGLNVTGEPHHLLTPAATWQGGVLEEPAAIPASGGGWWLFYSGNRFDTAAYATGVAWCVELEGPCQDASPGPFLATEGTRFAPGGLETFKDAHGDLWAVYDTWNRPARNGRFFCCRSLYLARILSS
jgi:hypothetical protein